MPNKESCKESLATNLPLFVPNEPNCTVLSMLVFFIAIMNFVNPQVEWHVITSYYIASMLRRVQFGSFGTKVKLFFADKTKRGRLPSEAHSKTKRLKEAPVKKGGNNRR